MVWHKCMLEPLGRYYDIKLSILQSVSIYTHFELSTPEVFYTSRLRMSGVALETVLLWKKPWR